MTQVSSPHKGDITSISYHPTEDIVITTSKDGTFKTWTKVVEESRSQGPSYVEYWTARSAGVYRNLQMMRSASLPSKCILTTLTVIRMFQFFFLERWFTARSSLRTCDNSLGAKVSNPLEHTEWIDPL